MYSAVLSKSPALVTDLYELTMAQGYWRHGMAGRLAVFQLFFRKAPFGGRFALACGMEDVLAYLRRWQFGDQDLAYLGRLTQTGGRPLFCSAFLEYLASLRFRGELLAVPEGTAVFPNEPILQVRAPLIVGQLLETALLNLIGFPTLVATKAARVCQAAQGDPVVEFGLRRAQGFEAGLVAARAAFIGGCVGTSNMLAGQMFNIPVRGTQAHSWVLSFDDELSAFRAYAQCYPDSCVLLVDTFDTIQGVRNAIQVALELKAAGHRLAGVRLDSGNLAELGRKVRAMFNEAGLTDVSILASGDLDEFRIAQLKSQGVPINSWGVGTRLVTAFDEPALTVVYKLAAIQGENGLWKDRMKISSERAKHTIPGMLRVRRFYQQGRAVCDVLYDERDNELDVFPRRQGKELVGMEARDLLAILLAGEEAPRPLPSLSEIREHVQQELASLPQDVLHLRSPKRFDVYLSRGVQKRQREVMKQAKEAGR